MNINDKIFIAPVWSGEGGYRTDGNEGVWYVVALCGDTFGLSRCVGGEVEVVVGGWNPRICRVEE